MANMQLTKTPMAEQDPQVRNQNFLEVARGYTLEEAMNEAKRCIHCKNPACVSGCPVGIPIPEFLDQVAQGNIAAAYEILSNANALPAISGRVCPQENQCEGKCVRGIKGEPVAIGRVERFVADWAAQQGVANTATAPKNGRKVAVIGSGPAGLTCAGELARMGYSVTVFEAFHTARRRTDLRHPRVPSPQGHRGPGGGQPGEDGGGDPAEHGHRQGADHPRAVRHGL